MENDVLFQATLFKGTPKPLREVRVRDELNTIYRSFKKIVSNLLGNPSSCMKSWRFLAFYICMYIEFKIIVWIVLLAIT